MTTEMSVSNTLDLKLNKDDLIEILVDNMLTNLENRAEFLRNQKREIREKKLEISKRYQNVLDKKFMKLLPKELKSLKIIKIDYNLNYQNATIYFRFEHFSVFLNQPQDATYNLSKKDEELIEKFKNQTEHIEEEESRIKHEIYDLNKNNKRIKAKMLKTFLSNSKEGKEILKLISAKEVELLN